MTIEKIYQKYNLLPNLRFHQYQVASVTKLIIDSLVGIEIEKDLQLKAALLHDMGNILKFDLEKFPETTEPEGLDYWMNVKNEFKEKYGEDETLATLKIAKEIGLNEKGIEILKSVGFSKGPENLRRDDIEFMIVGYADARVNFGEIVSIDERFEKTLERKKANYASQGKVLDETIYHEQHNAFREIEKKIFSHVKITPEMVTSGSIDRYIVQLSEYMI